MSNIWENPSKTEIIKTKIEITLGTDLISDKDINEISHARWLGVDSFLLKIYQIVKMSFFD